MNTLFVLPTNWDLAIDSVGNIALAENPYSLAQDAASAIKTFYGEAYYDTKLGVPYFTQIFNNGIPLELMRTQFVDAALTVPEVIASQVFFTGVNDRMVTGQVQITDNKNNLSSIGF